MNKIKQWLADKKNEAKLRRKEMLHDQFDVAEVNGCLYLTHNGVAFKTIDSDTSAKEITVMIESSRAAAIKCEGL